MPRSLPYPEPPIELLPGDVHATTGSRRPGRRRFLWLFIGIFLVAGLASLAFTFQRPAVYRSTATVRIAPPAALDRSDSVVKDDYIAVQDRVLTSQEVLAQVRRRLGEALDQAGVADHPLALRRMLDVVTLPEGYMVELRAQGENPTLLAELVNTWLDVYKAGQADSHEADSEVAQDSLRRQSEELDRRLAEQRQALEAYSREHDIVSLQREENRILSRLKGLSDSLNKAEEEAARTEAELEAVSQAAVRGESLVGRESRAQLNRLEDQASGLRDRLQDYARRFTPAYMELDPNIVAQQAQLDQLEERIAQLRRQGRAQAVAEARRQWEGAQAHLANLQRQLDQDKHEVRRFQARFAEYETMQRDLEQLEELGRAARERLLAQEVTDRDQAAQVTVLDPAFVPDRPLYPDYTRDAALSLAGSFLLALLVTGGYYLFTRPPRREASPRYQPVPVIYPAPSMSSAESPAAMDRDVPVERLDHRPQRPSLSHQHPGAPAPRDEADAAAVPVLPRELSPEDVNELLAAGQGDARLLVLLLLSGLRTQEAADLFWRDVHLDKGTLHIPGAGARTLSLHPLLRRELEQRSGRDPHSPLWQTEDGRLLTEQDCQAMIQCLAIDAGLSHPEQIGPELLRHTYLAWLVRQGLRLGELHRVAGRLAPTVLSGYGIYAPPGRGRLLEQVDTVYPALRPAADRV